MRKTMNDRIMDMVVMDREMRVEVKDIELKLEKLDVKLEGALEEMKRVTPRDIISEITREKFLINVGKANVNGFKEDGSCTEYGFNIGKTNIKTITELIIIPFIQGTHSKSVAELNTLKIRQRANETKKRITLTNMHKFVVKNCRFGKSERYVDCSFEVMKIVMVMKKEQAKLNKVNKKIRLNGSSLRTLQRKFN